MTNSSAMNYLSPRVPLTDEGKRREAIAALQAVLATVEQRRPELSLWESFHFRRGLNALLAGDYKKVWDAAEDALTPFAERTARAKAEMMRAAGAADQRTITMLRRELADVRAEPSTS
jgi:hypothetical protein